MVGFGAALRPARAVVPGRPVRRAGRPGRRRGPALCSTSWWPSAAARRVTLASDDLRGQALYPGRDGAPLAGLLPAGAAAAAPPPARLPGWRPSRPPADAPRRAPASTGADRRGPAAWTWPGCADRPGRRPVAARRDRRPPGLRLRPVPTARGRSTPSTGGRPRSSPSQVRRARPGPRCGASPPSGGSPTLGRPPARLLVPGPHPALRRLLGAGFRIVDADVLCASDADLFDPAAQIPSATVL